MKSDFFGNIFKTLDINYDNGLIDESNKSLSTYQKQVFKMIQDKLGINAVYFLRDSEGMPKIPLIYFAAVDNYDTANIAELHRMAWNLCDAPLLFVVTPEYLMIYNTYAAPTRNLDGTLDEKAGLIETIERINTLEMERRLVQFHRLKLETGEFWREHSNDYRFDVKNRVDISLMNNLRFMRKFLISSIRKRFSKETIDDDELVSIVHALLGRSILIKYLEERSDKNGKTVFPAGFFGKFKEGATHYTDLLNEKSATYKLFNELAEHFNGDMFPLVKKEFDVISEIELIELSHFIKGTTDYSNFQYTLWSLYSFNVIPIQLISSIYELFFHLKVDDKANKAGTYYTPYHLVSFLLDEVLPWEGPYEEKKILDPSCGSGIFLVEAYRRLVGKWIYSNTSSPLTNVELKEIMENCIFGVDLNEEAVRIASFSLSLVMCDYLEPRSIWETLVFPRLLGNNLFSSDFFAHGKFEEQKYDIIIGNPPWESKLSDYAIQYKSESHYPIGDNQIAQAFTWKAGELSKDSGIVCLLMPSKALLFNRSTFNTDYRKNLFEHFNVEVVINFSIFRKTLFSKATGPATAIVFTPNKVDRAQPIFYCTPKPTFTIEDRRRFLIEPSDICRIPYDTIDDQLIWKIAMWGTPRDLELINRLHTKFKSVNAFFDDNDIIFAEGIIEGTTKKKEYPQYREWPVIETNSFEPFYIKKENQKTILSPKFYRCARKEEVFKAPHMVFKQSPKKGRFISAVVDFDALFVNSFIGIHGDVNYLKYLSVLLYSKVFVYYSLMTSRRWLVERDELNVEEVLSFPLPNPTDEEISKAISLYDSFIKGGLSDTLIDEYAYQIYDLREYEIEFVENAVANIYDYFYGKGNSIALSKPTEDTFLKYQNVLADILRQSIGQHVLISTKIFQGNAPLAVLSIYLGKKTDVPSVDHVEDLNELLQTLDSLLLSERSGSVFVKRNVRVYNSDTIYIIKPNQSRYWSYSCACNDADEIYADIMRTWRDMHGWH